MKKTILLLTLCFSFALFTFSQKTMNIEYTETAPSIDGDTSDIVWTSAMPHPIAVVEKQQDSRIDGFSAYFKVLWNDTALFFMVYVEDEYIYAQDLWKADIIETYYHFGADSAITDGNIGGDKGIGYFQVPFRITGWAATGQYQQDSTKNHAVPNITEDVNWILEGYSLWSQFNNAQGDTIVPGDSTNFTFDFDIAVNDNDDANIDGTLGWEELSRIYWSSSKALFEDDWSEVGEATLVGKPVSDEFISFNNNFRYYPNPVENTLTIEGNVSNIEVMDLLGKKVLSSDVNRNNVSLSSLESGLYIVNFYNNGQLLETGKIYKN